MATTVDARQILRSAPANRNFEGRQGAGARARFSQVPSTAAASSRRRACIADPRETPRLIDASCAPVIRSCTVVLPSANIDTDQIVPARFLTTTTTRGARLDRPFRRLAFRLGMASRDPEFALNQPAVAEAAAGVSSPARNFGCGSSREHAPWALRRLRISAPSISTEIADIFRRTMR